jgi:hypothetical protein
MGDFRNQADQSLPPRYGNSPGADYFGGASQLYAAQGSRPDLYGTTLPNGERVYNLDAQVAAHYTIHQQLSDGSLRRTLHEKRFAKVGCCRTGGVDLDRLRHGWIRQML